MPAPVPSAEVPNQHGGNYGGGRHRRGLGVYYQTGSDFERLVRAAVREAVERGNETPLPPAPPRAIPEAVPSASVIPMAVLRALGTDGWLQAMADRERVREIAARELASLPSATIANFLGIAPPFAPVEDDEELAIILALI